MILSFFKKLSEFGVNHNNTNQKNKTIKLVNLICVFWYFAFILTSILSYAVNQNFSKGILVNSIGFILILSFHLINKRGKLIIASFGVILYTAIHYFIVTTYMAPQRFVEFFYLIVPTASLVFFNRYIYSWFFLIISILLFHYTFIFLDFYNAEGVLFLPPLMIFLFLINFLIVLYFKKLNVKNEKLLAIERDKALSDKIILEKQEIELRELNEFKSHFFVNLSHEIRTPITLIKGYTSNINLNDQVNINEEKLAIVGGQIKQIESILNNILNLSKLDANKLKLDRNDIEIIPFLNKHYANFKALFNKKDIDFNLNTNNLHIKVNMDANLIEKSINNLLSNALKFTSKKGTVSINVQLNDDLEINFTDNGIGIPEKDIDKIFERFYQSENHITKSQGSGIGLSFTKSIIDAHGFSILVNSKPNLQTIFKIIIPKQFIVKIDDKEDFDNVNKNTNVKNSITQQFSKNNKAKTILIVDDHEQMRSYLSNTLKSYNILEAGNGKEALTVLKNKKVDLLLTDYMMPIMDGKALVKEVKRMNLKIPVIVLTARSDHNAKLNMLRIGVDGYLNKPFIEEELLLFIKKSLELYNNIISTHKDLTPIEKKEYDKTSQKFNQKILNIINKNISNTNFTVQDIASNLNMSQSTLNRRTKSILGQTTQQVIMRVRVEKARQLQLENPYLSKKEIGYKVGISNTTYLFKKINETYGGKN